MSDVIDSTLMPINKGNAKGTHQRGLSFNVVYYSRTRILALHQKGIKPAAIFTNKLRKNKDTKRPFPMFPNMPEVSHMVFSML